MFRQDRRSCDRPGDPNKSAYDQALRRDYDCIRLFLYRLSHNAALADDMTQETFLSAWRKLDQFDWRSSFITWLYKISLNIYREYRRTQHLVEVPFDEDALAFLDSDLLTRYFRDEALSERIEQAVATLSDASRETLILHCCEGLKYSEIAEVLEVPVGTAKSRVSVSLDMLRKALGKEVESYDTETV